MRLGMLTWFMLRDRWVSYVAMGFLGVVFLFRMRWPMLNVLLVGLPILLGFRNQFAVRRKVVRSLYRLPASRYELSTAMWLCCIGAPAAMLYAAGWLSALLANRSPMDAWERSHLAGWTLFVAVVQSLLLLSRAYEGLDKQNRDQPQPELAFNYSASKYVVVPGVVVALLSLLAPEVQPSYNHVHPAEFLSVLLVLGVFAGRRLLVLAAYHESAGRRDGDAR